MLSADSGVTAATLPRPTTAATAAEPVPQISARTRLLLDGPILSTLLRLAAPNIVVVLVQAASSTFDTFFVARLGTDALAGVALVFPAWMLMVTMSAGGIGGGIASAIARALGAGKRSDADALATHALIIGIAMSAAFSAIFLVFGPSLYQALGGSGAALEAATIYGGIIFSGAIAVWLVNTFGSMLRGSGEMVVPAIVVVGGEVLHVLLAPTLVFGLGPFPRLGVSGAAASLVTSYVLRAAVLGGYVLQGRATVRLRRATPRARYFWEILRVGLPGSVNTVLTNLNVAVVTGIVGTYGTAALAGYGLGSRLEYLQIPLVFGFGTALVTLVGTNVGAGQIARARRVAWVGAGLAAAVTGSIGLTMAVIPQLWLGTFTSAPEVIGVGETYFHFVGPTYAFFGLGLALYFASQGAGRLVWPLLAGVARLLVVALGGWLAINWLNASLAAVFGTIAVSFVLFGLNQALFVRINLRQT